MIFIHFILHLATAYQVGQNKDDIDNIASEGQVGQHLIKEVRAFLRKGHDQTQFLIYLNNMEAKVASLTSDEFQEQCDTELLNIEETQRMLQDSKYRVTSLENKIALLTNYTNKFAQIIDEKQAILEVTENTVSELVQIRENEIAMFERRRSEITMSSGIVRRSKGLIGQLIPKMPDLAPQTKFAKQDNQLEVSYDDIRSEFLQIRSQAKEQLGESNPFSQIIESFAQIPEQTGNLEHVTYVVDMLANMEQNLADTNIALFNAEQQRIELHERLLEHVDEKTEKLNEQISELEQMIADMEQQIEDHQAEIQVELENQENIHQIYEEYIDAHESTLHTHDEDIKNNILLIKMIRTLKNDFMNDFEASSRYILTPRFHFQNLSSL
ncbi:unnamed protein product [Paramecium pentaurelia]|uniref:Uncharacterized protein n=1 Tax=Paramecium pentaurelia TaxID=43138 RepID=A0A8S1YF20_9CILI|nr:unnamed protein product [Paramecium pentaurelia]